MKLYVYKYILYTLIISNLSFFFNNSQLILPNILQKYLYISTISKD